MRINRHKSNNKKHSTNNTKHNKYKYTYYQNTHTHTHTHHTHTHTHTHTTHTHTHITQQVITTTVQDKHQMKQSQYNQVPSAQDHPNVHGTFFRKDKNTDYCTCQNHISLSSSYNLKSFKKKLQRKSEHILCSITCFQKSFHLRDNVEKYCRAVQGTYVNMAHAHCMLDT